MSHKQHWAVDPHTGDFTLNIGVLFLKVSTSVKENELKSWANGNTWSLPAVGSWVIFSRGGHVYGVSESIEKAKVDAEKAAKDLLYTTLQNMP